MAATALRAAGDPADADDGVPAWAATGARGSRTIARASAARRRTGREDPRRRARSLVNLVIRCAFHGGGTAKGLGGGGTEVKPGRTRDQHASNGGEGNFRRSRRRM